MHKGERMAEATKPKTNGAEASDSKTPNMPLFYKKPAPLDKRKHANLALKKNFGMGFAKNVNAVPVNLIEMPQICHFYPIAFSPDNSATPVAILGLRDNENLFVDDAGDWAKETYIPAYIRRYPFIFSEMPEAEQLSLCVDMDESVIEENGEGRFFDEDGNATTLAQNALEFCKSYHAASQQTLEFSKFLASQDLLTERAAEIVVGDNKKIQFAGFKILDEKKFAELSDKDFLEWRKKGWLPFLYAHLFSGMQWQRLTKLLQNRI